MGKGEKVSARQKRLDLVRGLPIKEVQVWRRK